MVVDGDFCKCCPRAVGELTALVQGRVRLNLRKISRGIGNARDAEAVQIMSRIAQKRQFFLKRRRGNARTINCIAGSTRTPVGSPEESRTTYFSSNGSATGLLVTPASAKALLFTQSECSSVLCTTTGRSETARSKSWRVAGDPGAVLNWTLPNKTLSLG